MISVEQPLNSVISDKQTGVEPSEGEDGLMQRQRLLEMLAVAMDKMTREEMKPLEELKPVLRLIITHESMDQYKVFENALFCYAKFNDLIGEDDMMTRIEMRDTISLACRRLKELQAPANITRFLNIIADMVTSMIESDDRDESLPKLDAEERAHPQNAWLIDVRGVVTKVLKANTLDENLVQAALSLCAQMILLIREQWMDDGESGEFVATVLARVETETALLFERTRDVSPPENVYKENEAILTKYCILFDTILHCLNDEDFTMRDERVDQCRHVIIRMARQMASYLNRLPAFTQVPCLAQSMSNFFLALSEELQGSSPIFQSALFPAIKHKMLKFIIDLIDHQEDLPAFHIGVNLEPYYPTLSPCIHAISQASQVDNQARFAAAVQNLRTVAQLLYHAEDAQDMDPVSDF